MKSNTTIDDLAGALSAFEDGEMDEDDFVRLFQYLIDTRLAWTLQGLYGRTAMRLIDDGMCHRPDPDGEGHPMMTPSPPTSLNRSMYQWTKGG